MAKSLPTEDRGGEGDRRKVEADLGPVRYLATLLGARDQDGLQWFILVTLLLLDLAAVLLLLAAAAAAQRRQGDAGDAAGQAQARPEGA